MPISVFMNFNKIKNLLNGGPESIIKKALSRSTILEFNEDQTKVKRRDGIPLKSQEEIDEATLYVEQIPMNSTHESISSVFSRFGKVNYVSLPRYKKSRQIKQFGFVEFDDVESMEKAITCFKKVDGLLQYSSLKAENLLSITTHEKDDEKAEPAETPAVEASTTEDKETEEPPVKKARIEGSTEPEAIVEDKVEEEVKPSTEVVEKMDLDEDVPTEEKAAEDTEEGDATKKDDEGEESETKPEEGAVKKKKNRHHKKKTGPKKGFFDERIMAMKVMRKKEWKKLRNAYLNSERQKAKEIKKILRDSYNKRNNNKIQEIQKYSPANTASPRINFYGSPNDREDPAEATFEPEANPSSGLAFISGVIVNIKFREPCLDFKELKKEFKQYLYVAYVDILEGGAQCFIRVDAPTSAQELVNQYSSCEYETDVLRDEAEKEYWKKIFEKRDTKKNKEVPVKKEQPVKRRRGREKLLDKINKAAQHIRFEESEDVVE